MKIIGETAEGFLLSATRTEIANLSGYYSEYSKVKFKPGDELEVSKIYKSFYVISKMARHDLTTSINSITSILKALEDIQSGTIVVFKESEKDLQKES